MRVSMPWSTFVSYLAAAGLTGAALAMLVVLVCVRLSRRIFTDEEEAHKTGGF